MFSLYIKDVSRGRKVFLFGLPGEGESTQYSGDKVYVKYKNLTKLLSILGELDSASKHQLTFSGGESISEFINKILDHLSSISIRLIGPSHKYNSVIPVSKFIAEKYGESLHEKRSFLHSHYIFNLVTEGTVQAIATTKPAVRAEPNEPKTASWWETQLNEARNEFHTGFDPVKMDEADLFRERQLRGIGVRGGKSYLHSQWEAHMGVQIRASDAMKVFGTAGEMDSPETFEALYDKYRNPFDEDHQKITVVDIKICVGDDGDFQRINVDNTQITNPNY